MYDFRGKRVLVAGGTGLIGTQLVRLLIEDGAYVTIASLDDPRRAHPEAEFLQIDLLDPRNCKKVCRGMDYVFNLLCIKGSPEAVRKRPEEYYYYNHQLDVNMSRAACFAGVRGYLLTSSLAVYTPAEVFREDDLWKGNPSSNDWESGWAKRMGEVHLEACRKQYGARRLSIVRPTNTYGPYDNFDATSSMIVPTLIRRVVSGENPLSMEGDGSAIRDFLHARDVARGMLHVAKLGFEAPVNLGSGKGVSIKELLETIISNVHPRPEVIWDKALRPVGDRIRILDVTRARSWGFEPMISLEEGIRETIEWYKCNSLVPNPKYKI